MHQPDSETRQELTARQLVAVLIRLLAVITLLGFVSRLDLLIGILVFTQDPSSAVYQLAPALIAGGFSLGTLVIVGWLWFFPETISDKIVPEEYDGRIRFDLSFREIQALVFSLLGVFLLTQAIPRLARTLAQTWVAFENESRGRTFVNLFVELFRFDLIETGALILLALALFWWSRRMIALLYRAKDSEIETHQ